MLTRRLRERDDAGFTLTELVVAMSIFTVVIVISLAALRTMVDSTVRSTGVADSRVEAERLYNRLDKIAPYAAAINPAGQAAGSWWIELRTDVDAGGQDPRCWQIRLDPTADQVQMRHWVPGAPATVSVWRTIAADAAVRTGTAPFTMIPATSTVARQRLVVAFDIAPVGAPAYPVDTTFTARNTSPTTSTNGGTAVCQEVARA